MNIGNKQYQAGFTLGENLPRCIPNYDLDFMEGLVDALCGKAGAAAVRKSVDSEVSEVSEVSEKIKQSIERSVERGIRLNRIKAMLNAL